MNSGLYRYVTPPAVNTCWICGYEVSDTSRQGKIPGLCGTSCDAAWRTIYGLDIATHTASDTEWVPVAAEPSEVSSRPAGKPGSWINPQRFCG